MNDLPHMPDEDAVRAFLKAHPGFLDKNRDLLQQSDSRQSPPDAQTPVVNFHQHAAKRLRADLDAARRERSDLLSVSLSNSATLSTTHQAVLALLEADNIHMLKRIIGRDLADILGIEQAALFMAGDSLPIHFLAAGLPSFGGSQIRKWMLDGRREDDGITILLRPKVVNARELYGDRAPFILSDALVQIPLEEDGVSLVLAMGARNEGDFHPGQATDFLRFMAQCLQRRGHQMVQQPATIHD